MYNKKFLDQMGLLLKCLPIVGKEERFALKGGTAINLFFSNLPRLSVDIDLTYLPIEDRDISIKNIENSLENIAKELKRIFPELSCKPSKDKDGKLKKYIIQSGRIWIKIEPSFVLRGHLYPTESWDSCEQINTLFDTKINTIPTLSVDEVYAGKLCAALSRQHPRDIFDMMIFLSKSKITTNLRQAFVVYLASNNKPIHEILSPNLNDIQATFDNEFLNMTETPVLLEDLLDVRKFLIDNVKESLTSKEREFLISVKSGNPKYDLLPFGRLEEWPGLNWKISNIKRMDEKKAKVMQSKLRNLLGL